MWKTNKLLRLLLLPFMMGIDALDGGGGGGGAAGGEPAFDMDSAVASIGEGLGFEPSASETDDEIDLLGDTGSDGDDTAGTGVAGTPPADESAAPAGKPADGTNPAAPPAEGEAAPKTWRPEAAAKWAALDPEIRAEVLKREADMFKGLETYKADATVGKGFSQIMQPYQQLLASEGVEPMQAAQQLMAAHAFLRSGTPEQKQAYFQQLGQYYGVQLQATDADSAPPYVDPEVAALRNELNSVKSNLNAEAQRRASETRQQIAAKIEAFATDPAHPYFDEVATDITKLLQTGMELAEAYEKAVWANPVTRAKELDRVTAEKAAKAQAEAKAKAEAARKATAANVKTKAKQASGTAPLGSIDETLKEAYRAATSKG